MAGHVPAIHALFRPPEDVDARHNAGADGPKQVVRHAPRLAAQTPADLVDQQIHEEPDDGPGDDGDNDGLQVDRRRPPQQARRPQRGEQDRQQDAIGTRACHDASGERIADLLADNPEPDRTWMMRDPQVLTEPKAIPPEIDRWNWGAFLLNWIWGVGNNTFIALLTLIPVAGIVMLFVLGTKGSRWAWRNGRWDSVAHFKRVQRLWAIWGAIIWIGVIALFGGLVGVSFYLLRHAEAYQLGVSKVQAIPVAVNILGTPISAGYPL